MRKKYFIYITYFDLFVQFLSRGHTNSDYMNTKYQEMVRNALRLQLPNSCC